MDPSKDQQSSHESKGVNGTSSGMFSYSAFGSLPINSQSHTDGSPAKRKSIDDSWVNVDWQELPQQSQQATTKGSQLETDSKVQFGFNNTPGKLANTTSMFGEGSAPKASSLYGTPNKSSSFGEQTSAKESGFTVPSTISTHQTSNGLGNLDIPQQANLYSTPRSQETSKYNGMTKSFESPKFPESKSYETPKQGVEDSKPYESKKETPKPLETKFDMPKPFETKYESPRSFENTFESHKPIDSKDGASMMNTPKASETKMETPKTNFNNIDTTPKSMTKSAFETPATATTTTGKGSTSTAENDSMTKSTPKAENGGALETPKAKETPNEIPKSTPKARTPRSAVTSTPVTPRSSGRQRKSVERLSPVSIERVEQRAIEIPAGHGNKLGDIAHVSKELSKRKSDYQPVVTLHRIIFGRPGEAAKRKAHLRAFNGFASNEESKKVNEKLSHHTVDELRDICILLNLERSGEKKVLAERIADFLQSPKDLGESKAAPRRTPQKRTSGKPSPKSAGKRKMAKTSKETNEEASAEEEEDVMGSESDEDHFMTDFGKEAEAEN